MCLQHRFTLSPAGIKGGEEWLQTRLSRERGASEGKQQAISSSQPRPPYLFPSINGNHWIIYKPLPLALCEGVCGRERGDPLSSPPPACCVLLLSVQLLQLSGCWHCWARARLFQLRMTAPAQASASAATASTDRRLLREPLRGHCCARSATDCPADRRSPLCPDRPVTQLSTLPSISAVQGRRGKERRGEMLW